MNYATKTIIFIGTLMMIICLGAGCSGSSHNPVIPTGDEDLTSSMIGPNGARRILETFEITLDSDEGTLHATPYRNAETHLNVSDYFDTPLCNSCFMVELIDFDKDSGKLDVNVTLTNSSNFDIYDLRGTIYTNEFGVALDNADGWTGLWDIPGGSDINPYKAFAVDAPDRAFPSGATESENLHISFPDAVLINKIYFVFDASWPGNCEEPYAIQNPVQSTLNDFVGATANLFIDVLDHDDDVDSVLLSVPEITGEDFVNFSHYNGDTYIAELVNSMGAPSGSYEAQVIASSSNDNDLALYYYFDVVVQPIGVLTVDYPNGGETWRCGIEKAILWDNGAIVGNVNLEFWNGSSWDIIAMNIENDGHELWTPMTKPVADSRVRVTSVDNPGISDESDGTFEILEYWCLTAFPAPYDSPYWTTGIDETFYWKYDGVKIPGLDSYVKVELYVDGELVDVIAQSVNVSDKACGYVPPPGGPFPTGMAQVKISSHLDSDVYDFSDYFSIGANPGDVGYVLHMRRLTANLLTDWSVGPFADEDEPYVIVDPGCIMSGMDSEGNCLWNLHEGESINDHVLWNGPVPVNGTEISIPMVFLESDTSLSEFFKSIKEFFIGACVYAAIQDDKTFEEALSECNETADWVEYITEQIDSAEEDHLGSITLKLSYDAVAGDFIYNWTDGVDAEFVGYEFIDDMKCSKLKLTGSGGDYDVWFMHY